MVGNSNDMFQNKVASGCPLDVAEISEIVFKLVDSNLADLTGNALDLIVMTGSGDI